MTDRHRAQGAGRFAPTPSGDLHVGNLRTAILAWLFARSTDRAFWLRIEDLDRARAGAEDAQLADLRRIGLTWDAPPVRQSDRMELYRNEIAGLREAGLLYECFCSRKDIAEAASAPHGAPGAYPGTCRRLSEAQRAERRRHRPAAWRLRSQVATFTVNDRLRGEYTGLVDDFVIVRSDGVPAYNLAVVVDDGEQGVDQVVRGDDLLSSAPRQAYLAELLGYRPPSYAHVPLALNSRGQRLAKRDGAVTLRQLGTQRALQLIFDSLHLPADLPDALAAFDPDALEQRPWVVGTGFENVSATN